MGKSKLIVGILIGFAVVISIGFIAFTKGMKDFQQKTVTSAYKTQAKMLLLQLRTHILIHQISTDSFENVDFSTFEQPEKADFVVGVVSTGPGDEEGFWTGKTSDSALIEKAKTLCPDCTITSEGFKLIVIGNPGGEFLAQTLTHEEDAEIQTLEVHN